MFKKKDKKIFTDNTDNVFLDNITIRNKVLIDNNQAGKEYIYDDGIDTQDNITIKFLTSKNVMLVVLILILIFTLVTVIKEYKLKDKVDYYEKFFTTIEKKEEPYAKVIESTSMEEELKTKFNADELTTCISAPLTEEELPESIKNIIKEINNYYNQSNDYFAFGYKDLYTGFTVTYNPNQRIFAASTIKAPKDIYLYEQASQGKIHLEDKLIYTPSYINNGSGVLKNKPVNTSYSIRTLLSYSTTYSDNAAHNMLMDKFGRENMLSFWKELGTNTIFTDHTNWGCTNVHDALIYMTELYDFSLSNKEFGIPLMENFQNAMPKFIRGKNDYKIANKSGWSGSAIHDVSIVLANNPYVVVALSNLGATDYYPNYFYNTNEFAYRLHTEYWKYKMNKCLEIKQYD